MAFGQPTTYDIGTGPGGNITLQDAYNNGAAAAHQTIQLSAANGGIWILDTATPLFNNFKIADSTGSFPYLLVDHTNVGIDTGKATTVGTPTLNSIPFFFGGRYFTGGFDTQLNGGELQQVVYGASATQNYVRLQNLDGGGFTGIRLDAANGGCVGIGTSSVPGAFFDIEQTGITSGTQIAFKLGCAANTGMTAGTEVIDAYFNTGRTVQWATGAITTQRSTVFEAPTYAFVAASTITNAVTVAITGAPAQGANATITNAYSLWVQAGLTQLDGNLALTGVYVGNFQFQKEVDHTISVANSTTTNTAGANLNFTNANGIGSGAGGSTTWTLGQGGATGGVGGIWSITGGLGGAATAAVAGGGGGAINITGGAGGAASAAHAAGAGANIAIVAGAAGSNGAGGGGANGGGITINAAAGSGAGTNGAINIGTANTLQVEIGVLALLDGGIQYSTIGTPATPSVGNTKMYVRDVGGKRQLTWMASDGVEIAIATAAV